MRLYLWGSSGDLPKVDGHEAEADLALFDLVQCDPDILDNSALEPGDRYVVLAHEIVLDGVLVPDLELQLAALGIANHEVKNLVPLRVASAAACLCCLFVTLHANNDVRVRVRQHFAPHEVAAFHNADIELTHCLAIKGISTKKRKGRCFFLISALNLLLHTLTHSLKNQPVKTICVLKVSRTFELDETIVQQSNKSNLVPPVR